MAVLNILSAFADPNGLDNRGATLINVRAIPRDQKEGRAGLVRLVGTPGLTTVCQPDNYRVIAIGAAEGTYWSVSAGGSVYRDVHTGSPLNAGNLAEPTSLVRLAEDITGLAIADDRGIGAVATLDKGVTVYSPGNWINPGIDQGGSGVAASFSPTTVCELDNITIWGGLAPQGGTAIGQQMYRSLALAPASVDAEWFASKEARADPLIDLLTVDRFMWCFGKRSIEHFYDFGQGVNFPFSPFPNSMLDVGLAARPTLAYCQSNLWFVGTDRRVWQGAGQQAQPVSAAWVDLLLQETDLSTLFGYAYAIGGDMFYVLTSDQNWTIEYATGSKLWNYRQTPGRNDHVGRCAFQTEGGLVLIGCADGTICRPDLTNASEPAGPIMRTIISQVFGEEETRHVVDQIDVTSSLTFSKAGSYQLDWTPDGGNSWKGLRTVPFPLDTVAHRRSVSRRLGTARRRQFRLRYSGPAAPFQIDEFYMPKTEGA
jgi:hypothetical protein